LIGQFSNGKGIEFDILFVHLSDLRSNGTEGKLNTK
jgi:hypothetical protein